MIALAQPAISQTDTSNIANDPVLIEVLDTSSKTLVCLELGILNKSIIDLELGDAARAKVPILEEQVETCLLVVEQTDSLLSKEKAKNKAIELEYEREIFDLNLLVDTNEELANFHMDQATKQKRQKNAIIIGGVTITVGVLVGVIYLGVVK